MYRSTIAFLIGAGLIAPASAEAAPGLHADAVRRAALPADTLTVDEVKRSYDEIFAVERDGQGRTYFALGEGEPVLPADHPLADLVRGNEFFFSYIIRNWTGLDDGAMAAFASDAAVFPENVYAALREDSLLSRVFLPIVARFLESRGGKLIGYQAGDEPTAVPMERALNVAVRFFYPDGVEDDGSLTAHVCVGINGLLDLEGPRDPYLEALAYLAINKEMLDSRYGVVERFLEVYKEVNALALSTDDETKVVRAQGAMWAGMQGSSELRTALLEEESRITAWLPIRIEGRPGPQSES